MFAQSAGKVKLLVDSLPLAATGFLSSIFSLENNTPMCLGMPATLRPAGPLICRILIDRTSH